LNAARRVERPGVVATTFDLLGRQMVRARFGVEFQSMGMWNFIFQSGEQAAPSGVGIQGLFRI